jgi:hypothetical protein
MIKFRERLTGAKESVHERSVIERVFRRELGQMPEDAGVRATPVSTTPHTFTSGGFGSAMFSSGGEFPRPTTGWKTGAAITSPTGSGWSSADTIAAEALSESSPSSGDGKISLQDWASSEDQYMDQFIHDYFSSLGLEYLSPYQTGFEVKSTEADRSDSSASVLRSRQPHEYANRHHRFLRRSGDSSRRMRPHFHGSEASGRGKGPSGQHQCAVHLRTGASGI